MLTLGRKLISIAAKHKYGNEISLINSKILRFHSKILSVKDVLVAALVAAEDRRFYEHCGLDIKSIGRAAISTFLRKKIQGASTIEQQLTRTIIKDYRISLRRKVKEILISVALSSEHDKDTLAKAYIFFAYYGWKMNGIEEALTRLNLPIENVTINEAATIVAMLKYPLPQFPNESRHQLLLVRSWYILQNVKRMDRQ